MRPRQDGASSPRRLFFEEDSEGSVEEYHNWPEGSEMQLVGGVEGRGPWAAEHAKTAKTPNVMEM